MDGGNAGFAGAKTGPGKFVNPTLAMQISAIAEY